MTRINIGRTNKLGYAAVIGLEGYARKSVDPDLYELIKLRASILNGCGFCVDMHATEGRKSGIPERKLHAVAAWQHSKVFFDAREQAVLALTDAVTQLGPDTVTDQIWIPESSAPCRPRLSTSPSTGSFAKPCGGPSPSTVS